MVALGQEIVPLHRLDSGVWSQFGHLFSYSNGALLTHALTSETVVCDAEEKSCIINGEPLGSRMEQRLADGGIIASPDDDARVFAAVKDAVGQNLEQVGVDTLFLIVTDMCNMRCSYCYENLPKYSTKSVMPLAAMTRAVDVLMQRTPPTGHPSVFFYGGEPMLGWRNVIFAIRYIRDTYGGADAVDIQIVTNGTVRPQELFEACRMYGVGIAVSLDGPEAVTNRFRKAASPNLNVFERAFALLRACRDAELDYAALCTVTRDNAPWLEEMAEFFVANNLSNMTFNLELGRAGEHWRDERPFWDELGMRMAAVYRFLRDRGIIDTRSLRYLTGITENRFTISECDAGYSSQMVVSPRGLVGPCQGYLHEASERWMPLEDAATCDVRAQPDWRAFRTHTTLAMPACRGCPAVGTCGGGCHYNRMNFKTPNPNFCQYIRSFLYHILHEFVQ